MFFLKKRNLKKEIVIKRFLKKKKKKRKRKKPQINPGYVRLFGLNFSQCAFYDGTHGELVLLACVKQMGI